uniref:Ig-like domain-containing protein n=1 Tax=Aquabacterium sp. TaxID=1872578 RepID=UPI0027BA5884
ASDSGNSSSDNLTRVTTPTFTGTAESGSLVTLYDTDGTTVLGTATATGGVWSITSSTLAEGSHSVTAKATDAAGNISVASSALTLTIDTTAPAIPAAPTLHAASDSGNSSSDNLTRVTTPTFTGTAESGSLVTLYDTDGTTVLGTATAIGGVWSITSSTLAEGSHSLMVKATDAAGNVSVASSVLTLTIDTTAPATPAAPTLNPASDSGSSGADNLTNVTTPTFTGTAESGSLVTLYDTDGTTVLGTATAAGSGNWSITSSALGAGAHTLTARVTDAAGNTSAASAGLVVTIDVTAPTAIALSASSVMDVATGLDTTVASLSSLDSQAVNYALVAGNGTNDADNARFVLAGGMLQSRAQLAAGAYNIRVSATDAAGNVSYQDFVVTVNSPPVPVLSSAAPLGLAGGAALSPSAQTPTATEGGEAQAPGLSFLSSGTVQAIPGFAADMAALNGASLWVPESVLTTSSPAAVRLGMNGSSGSTGAGLRALVPTHEVVIERGEQLTFTLPEGSFGHSDAAALVTLSARLADGRPLPGYLHFDPATGTFTFDEEVDERVKQLKVVITAVDDKGQTAGITVVIKLKDKARNTDAIELPLKAGKLALSEQLRLADRPAGTLADLAALSKAFAASHAEHGRA